MENIYPSIYDGSICAHLRSLRDSRCTMGRFIWYNGIIRQRPYHDCSVLQRGRLRCKRLIVILIVRYRERYSKALLYNASAKYLNVGWFMSRERSEIWQGLSEDAEASAHLNTNIHTIEVERQACRTVLAVHGRQIVSSTIGPFITNHWMYVYVYTYIYQYRCV
jgi:hypothetical protein